MAADKKTKKDKRAEKAEKKARKAQEKAVRKAEKKALRDADKQTARTEKIAGKMGKAAKAARKGGKRNKKGAPDAREHRERRQPESLRLRSASPSFTVDDLQRSLAFYTDVLGFIERERWETNGTLNGVELVAGRVSVFLAQDNWEKGRDRAKGQGFRIYFDTVQDVDALARRVRERGGTLAEEPQGRPWGGRDFAVVDPDGFKITFSTV